MLMSLPKNFKIILSADIKRELKKLSKKYTSLQKDFISFLDDLQQNPTQGTPLGKDCYKVRLKIESKNAGKSGGARILTCVKIIKSTIFLFGIYDKSEISTLTDKEIKRRLSELDDL
jgi:mRNA-degrading endonuclease RelE of RelBE toxin-antitoxin system